jgi:hypothetical protein
MVVPNLHKLPVRVAIPGNQDAATWLKASQFRLKFFQGFAAVVGAGVVPSWVRIGPTNVKSWPSSAIICAQFKPLNRLACLAEKPAARRSD